MRRFVFTKKAKKEFEALDESVQERIMKKLLFLKGVSDPDIHFKILHDLAPATHRLWVGAYRLILAKRKEEFLVLRVGHRREIYR